MLGRNFLGFSGSSICTGRKWSCPFQNLQLQYLYLLKGILLGEENRGDSGSLGDVDAR